MIYDTLRSQVSGSKWLLFGSASQVRESKPDRTLPNQSTKSLSRSSFSPNSIKKSLSRSHSPQLTYKIPKSIALSSTNLRNLQVDRPFLTSPTKSPTSIAPSSPHLQNSKVDRPFLTYKIPKSLVFDRPEVYRTSPIMILVKYRS